ncbi:MAG: YecA/YgfB family protein [Ramlibacter sp.]
MNAPTSPSPAPAAPGLAPLGPDDFDAQDAELDALREHDPEMPQWEFCEGFLAALVCARRPVPPQEYWPVLLGDDFNPMAHMEFVWRWKRRWAEVAAALDAPVERLDDERTYQPEVLDTRGAVLALPEADRGDTDMANLPAYGQVWALGFLYAVETWPEDWAPPRHEEAARILDDALSAIVRVAGEDRDPPTVSMVDEDGPPSVSEQRLDDFGAAIWAVYDLRLLWKSVGTPVATIRKAPEPGRNDPCPCGSGKKYKKCCGAA